LFPIKSHKGAVASNVPPQAPARGASLSWTKGRPVRTIAIINQKGGCGKTTVAINLASVMAARGRRTLLVDVDPQSHCALGLAVPEQQIDRCIADVLRHGLSGQIAFSDIVWQISRNLDLAPSSMALAGIEQELTGAHDRDRRLAQVLATVADRYDFCIIDCPPSIGLLTFNALRAAGEVIIPVETGYFALQGAVKQEATIQMLAQRVNHRARFSVLATMYDVRTKLAREILRELKKSFGDALLPTVINFNSKLKEAASFGQPITEYDPGSRGMQDFDELAGWLLANPPVMLEAEPVTAAAGTGPSPALSRAAELVERARALSARTAALSAKLATDRDMVEEFGPEEALPSGASTFIAPPQPITNDNSNGNTEEQTGHAVLLAQKAPALTAAPPQVQQRVARLYGVRPTQQGLLFVQPSNIAARQLMIAGDFNNWIPERTPMRRDDNLGVWQAVVPVPAGRYRYRIFADGKWMQDAYNTYVESNPFGELNNVVEIVEA
jgi:chromosome partitioning protein